MSKSEDKGKIVEELIKKLKVKLDDKDNLTQDEEVHYRNSLKILEALVVINQGTILSKKVLENLQNAASYLNIDTDLAGNISEEIRNKKAQELFIFINKHCTQKETNEVLSKGETGSQADKKVVKIDYEGENYANKRHGNNEPKKRGSHWWVVTIVAIIILSITIPVIIFLSKPGIYYNNTIEYEVNGKRYTVDADYKEKVKIEIPYKIGYNFMGLYDENGLVLSFDENGYSLSDWIYKTRGEVYRLFPVFEPIAYSISLDAKGGYFSVDGRIEERLHKIYEIKYEENLSDIENIPLRKGYIFSGWALNDGTMVSDESGKIFDEKKQFGSELCSIAENCDNVLNLYARWNPISYKVIFYSNTEANDIATQEFIYDKAQALSNNPFENDGYNFSGWNTQKDASGISYKNLDEVINLCNEEGEEYILYAQWTKQSISDVTYKVNDRGTATITGVSERVPIDADTLEIPSELDGFTVSVIANEAFKGTNFISIYIPETVTEIGEKIFSGASKLETVVVEEGNKVYFSENNGIIRKEDGVLVAGCKTTVISKNVKIIKKGAFDSISLKIVEIPSTVNLVEFEAFKNCGTETITVDENNQFYYKSSSAVNAIISKEPSGVLIAKQEPGTLIYGCQNTNIPQEYNVTSIGDYAFAYTTMETVNLPATLKTIGENAFSNCVNLSSITMPASVTNIKESAFSGCEKLTNIVFEKDSKLNSIAESAFENCPLKTVEIPTLAIKAASKGSLTSVKIISGSSIVDNAFMGCTELISITIPSTVTTIGDSAFSGCNALTEITIPSMVTTIGADAFSGCKALTEITIPSSVTYIGANAFSGCSSLVIYAKAESKHDGWVSGWNSDNLPVVWGSVTENKKVEINGFLWQFINGNAKLIKYSGTSKAVVVEENIVFQSNSYTFTEIAENAFQGKSDITSITIPLSVKSIGANAFSGCSALTEIIIPSSVTSIGASAFSGCTNLVIYAVAESKPNDWDSQWNSDNLPVVWGHGTDNEKVELDGFLWKFSDGNAKLIKYSGTSKAVVVEENIVFQSNSYTFTEIAANAFQGNSIITSVTIPSSVDTIGFAAFKGCDNLQTLTINSSSLTFVKDNGENAPVISDQETEDKDAANMGYLFGIEYHDNNAALVPGSLKTIELPNMNEIHSFLFYNFVNLQSVVLSEDLRSIGDLAFRGTGIKTIDLNNCTNIGDYAFYGCESLQEVKCSASEISVGQYAFAHCVDLNSESVNSLLSKMGKVTHNVFYNTGVKSLVIPEQFSAQTETPNRPFGESSPTSVTLPANKFGWLDYINKSQVRTIVFTGETELSLTAKMFAGFTALENILLPINTTGFTEDVFPSVKDAGRRYAIYCSFGKDKKGLTDDWNKEHRVIWNYKNAGYIEGMHYLINDVKKQAVLIGVFDDSINDKTIPGATLSYNSYTVTISQNVFDYSDAKVRYENNIGYIGNWAVGIKDDYEDSVTQIHFKEGTVGIIDYAFTSCTGLETIEFKQDVIIGDYAFYGCSSLSSVTIAEGKKVTFVGEWAFTHCTSLTEVNTLIENLTIIPDHAFYNTGITTLTINAEIVDTSAFAYCKSLENIAFNENVQINDYAFEGCNNLSNITIADGKKITAIGEGAFSECENLSEIDEVIKNVTTIPVKAFYKTGIKQITVSTITRSIESEAFSECNSLTTIIFDFRQRKIIVKGKSFANCSQLNEVRYHNFLDKIELCENWDFGIENDIQYKDIGPVKGEHAIIKGEKII